MNKEKQIEKEIEEMAHSLRIRKLDNEKIGFDVLSRLTGNAYEDEETSIARHIITQLGYRKQSWVAIEIFEEIESLITRYFNENEYTVAEMEYDITEFIKKYTEENI